MRNRNINEVTHEWLESLLSPSSIVVDATAGNGHDTLFLSEHSKWVYAFDVSELAIMRTKERTHKQHNITYILDSHANIKQHVKQKVHGIMYNCGYLPNSDHQQITKAESTVHSLNQAYELMETKSWFCVTVYRKHDHGQEEADAVLTWLKQHTNIQKVYTYEGVKQAPIAYLAFKL